MVNHLNPRARSKRQRITLADVLIYIALVLLSLVCLYPLYQIFVASISDPAVVASRNGLVLWPVGVHFDAYKIVLNNQNILNGFRNTFFYMTLGTAFRYVVTALAAYPLSLRNAKLKRPLMLFMTFTMYFSGGLIPYYLLINNLGLMNTPWVLIIPGGVSVWDIIIMRTQFQSLPDSLMDAAYIDGATAPRILFSILLPLSKAVSAVLILFSVVGFWNMWFEPMIFLTQRSMYPLQSVLREILIDSNEHMLAGSKSAVNIKLDPASMNNAKLLIKYANIIVCTVPILAIYPFAQKHFVKGVMIGSLKG